MFAEAGSVGRLGAGARWSVMVVSLGVTATSFLFINGVAFLIPSLQARRGIPLAEAGLVSSMPSWGMVVTLVLWGWILDRVGERVVLTAGSVLTAAAACAAASAHSMLAVGVFLFLGGMAAASCNTAGGRLVSAWFPSHQRGLAMGIRQTAQPLGIALGALVIPELAERGPRSGLMFLALMCTVAAVASALGIVDPPRKSRKAATGAELASPYRGSFVLWRIHAVSALLMMPQTVTVTFMFVWLMNRHGWSVAAAGGLVTVCQLLGAVGRIAVGRWSDRVGSRMRPVRAVAIAAALALLLLAFTDATGSSYDVVLMVAISVLAVLDNGLEATAITEIAGPFWSGRALGLQNTAQRLMAAAGPPLFGALIVSAEYPPAWALCALFPLAAVPLVPTDSERRPGIPDRASPPGAGRDREVIGVS
ncbi:MFS transporter [Mycobacterium sp. E342]|uniref:MFS transporter n=1 Tax=Mycobacterium sp. E342 TaxID=1834147 RepID=UPI0008005100|nr:MFS transporter [Mycobacterium sp. E342]OBH29573.1 MFS transporter [Mycobacterium sp. E342]